MGWPDWNRAQLAVMETWEGPCALAHGRCTCCGWEGIDAFDIGLEDVGNGEYAWN